MRIGTEVRGLFVQMEKEFPDLGLGPGAEESQQLDPHPLLWDLSCPACTWSLEGYLRFSLLLRRETSGGLVQIVSQAPQLSHAQPIIHSTNTTESSHVQLLPASSFQSGGQTAPSVL